MTIQEQNSDTVAILFTYKIYNDWTIILKKKKGKERNLFPCLSLYPASLLTFNNENVLKCTHLHCPACNRINHMDLRLTLFLFIKLSVTLYRVCAWTFS